MLEGKRRKKRSALATIDDRARNRRATILSCSFHYSFALVFTLFAPALASVCEPTLFFHSLFVVDEHIPPPALFAVWCFLVLTACCPSIHFNSIGGSHVDADILNTHKTYTHSHTPSDTTPPSYFSQLHPPSNSQPFFVLIKAVKHGKKNATKRWVRDRSERGQLGHGSLSTLAP